MELSQKIEKAAELIRKAKNIVAMTGAGIRLPGNREWRWLSAGLTSHFNIKNRNMQ